MKILTGTQIRDADRFTIENEPVAGIDLMERAAEVLAQWICNHVETDIPLCFFIGKGNNGGDGLAVARMLYNVGYSCDIYCGFDKKELSEECRFNWERLPKGLKVKSLDRIEIREGAVVVDALLGTGVRGEITEPVKGQIDLINSLDCRVIAIDVPSGMLTEYGNAGRTMVRATDTLAIEFPKLAELLPEGGENAGNITVLPIDLDPRYMKAADSPYYFVDEAYARSLILSRDKFAHKGTYGHALLVCGSEGMAGAAVLASGAALRSGCGLVTVHVPKEERGVIHASNPSAIVSCDPQPVFSELPGTMGRYTAVGVGCGVGRDERSLRAFERLLGTGTKMVIDADGLNMLAAHPHLQSMMPSGAVLTPHIGELRRLVGEWTDDARRNEMVKDFAAAHDCYIVVKGVHTMVCTPDGRMFFNSTGNPGMAKGGSGDVLTGYIAGLLARGYQPEQAAVLGAYVHGRAGDKAAEYYGQEGMNSADMIDFLGEAFADIQ